MAKPRQSRLPVPALRPEIKRLGDSHVLLTFEPCGSLLLLTAEAEELRDKLAAILPKGAA